MRPDCKKLKENFREMAALRDDAEPFLNNPEILRDGRQLNESKEIRQRYWELKEECLDLLPVSPEMAKRIMGKDFLGAEAVNKAWECVLKDEDLPKIPFSRQELWEAKERGEFLIFRIDYRTVPLTMKVMNEFQEEYFKEQFVKFLLDKDKLEGQDFYDKQVPRYGWALVGKGVIENTKDENAIEQLEIVIDYLKNEVYKDRPLPPEYQEAVEEYEKKKNEPDIKRYGWGRLKVTDFMELKINQLTKQTPVEFFYDILTYYLANRGERIMERGPSAFLNGAFNGSGQLIFAGNFTTNGLNVGERNLSVSHNYLGLTLSRRF